MQKRRLGRTNLQVSIVGFGGTWISELSTPEAVNVVRKAFDLGINYFDTAKLDGNSEKKSVQPFNTSETNASLPRKRGRELKKNLLKTSKAV